MTYNLSLIHIYLQKALERVITRIEGSYALCIVSTIEPDKVFIAKKDSPLVIGKTADASVAASDIPAILDYTKDVYFLEDYEIAILNKGNVSFFDQYGNPCLLYTSTTKYLLALSMTIVFIFNLLYKFFVFFTNWF